MIIDEHGSPIIDCDFDDAIKRIVASDAANCFNWLSKGRTVDSTVEGWAINIKNVYNDPDLTMDPKRYGEKGIKLRKTLLEKPHLLLEDIVGFIPERQSTQGKTVSIAKSELYQHVEIQDIGFGDYHSKEIWGWELPSRARHFSEADDIYIDAIWGSAVKWCYIPQGVTNVVVTNGCFRCRVKPGMEQYTADLLAYLNSEGWGVQMRSFARGSDGLAEICEDDVKKVIIPLLTDTIRESLSEYVQNLQHGTTTLNRGIRNNWLKIAKQSEYFSAISG